jgi:hypothetical protein
MAEQYIKNGLKSCMVNWKGMGITTKRMPRLRGMLPLDLFRRRGMIGKHSLSP